MKMKNKFVKLHRELLLAGLYGTVCFAIYAFLPPVFQSALLGLSIITHAQFLLGWLGVWVILLIICAALTQVYTLVNLKDDFLTASLGFSLSYFATSFVTELLIAPDYYVRVAVVLLIAYASFMVSSFVSGHIVAIKPMRLMAGAFVLLVTAYGTFQVVLPLTIRNAAEVYAKEQDAKFKSTLKNLDFKTYYPTYQSSSFKLSPAKLNGYGGNYRTPYVSFEIGSAYVKEGPTLARQSEVMDFKNNCDISRLWYATGAPSGLTDDDIATSLDDLKKCNLLQTTESGVKIYLQRAGQWTYAYTQIDSTNIIIEFDDLNGRKYDASKEVELLRVISSLKPLGSSAIQMGGSDYGEYY